MNTKALTTPKKGPARKRSVLPAGTSPLIDGAGKHSRCGHAEILLVAVAGLKEYDRQKVIDKVRKGLRFTAVPLLEKAMGLSRQDMPGILAISPSTLSRRKSEGKLRPEESDRLVRYARLKDAANEMMLGDTDAATNWLKTPVDIFSGNTPLSHAGTEMGARDVEDLIGRIQHGVFS